MLSGRGYKTCHVNTPVVVSSILRDRARCYLDAEYVQQREHLVTRGWRRLQELAGMQGMLLLDYPLPEVRARMNRNTPHT